MQFFFLTNDSFIFLLFSLIFLEIWFLLNDVVYVWRKSEKFSKNLLFKNFHISWRYFLKLLVTEWREILYGIQLNRADSEFT